MVHNQTGHYGDNDWICIDVFTIKHSIMKEKLMFGHLGSGLRVWDTKQQEHAGYKPVAHIARDRTITYYDRGLSEEAKQTIENFAKFNNMTRSVTQDDLVLDHVDYSQIDIQVLKLDSYQS